MSPLAQEKLQFIEDRIAVLNTEAAGLRRLRLDDEANQIEAVVESLLLHRADHFEANGPIVTPINRYGKAA